MDHARKRKPLWRWEVFLFAVVLVLAMAASLVSRIGGVLGAVLSIALLVLAIVAALLLIVPLLRPKGRDSENTRTSLEGLDLVEIAPVHTVRVLESERRQTGIEAARAKTKGEPTAILTPDASRWLGLRLRIAVDLRAGDGQLYRAGFLPPELEPAWNARLLPLASEHAAAEVQARIVGTERPFRVEVLLDTLVG
ncbi:hypothetical protein [Herbiconiux sp.]|uniref:hypothetical protein n=1 Tax=Herbiconiux sp. TaxID=1871186 RepID=UPI0025BF6CB0|nr:hypothetical protein [Herbiconiux sp.]